MSPYLFSSFLSFAETNQDMQECKREKYISLYYNPNNNAPDQVGNSDSFMTDVMDQSSSLAASRYMSSDFDFDFEMHMGETYGKLMTLYSSNVTAALGLPFVFKWDQLNSRKLTFEEKKEMMNDELAELKTNLTIDKSNISAAIRRKTSAPDYRTSSSGLGCFGITLLVISLSLIVYADCTGCRQSQKKSRKKRIYCRKKGNRC
ncbi:Hypothetical predicted protein [Mytilus galloprovincialis]|uniref:Uncharacterized protein n=1 Tax=Mytilus galloprovincialis TaxID=29158 RepID=A0A8B6GW81_MYTGA|nr:Hypothetical predicted protein [Mytilus galloprovincialis]